MFFLTRKGIAPLHNMQNLRSESTVSKKEVYDWLPYFAGTLDLDSKLEKRDLIESFWYDVLSEIELLVVVESNEKEFVLEKPTDIESSNAALTDNELNLVDEETRTIKVPKSQFVNSYKTKVYQILEDNKKEQDPVVLKRIQKEIEDLTLHFSEASMFASCPNIMTMITKTNKPNAKEFLRGVYHMDMNHSGRMTILEPNSMAGLSAEEQKKYHPLLSDSDQSLLKEFGEHTLECLLVHTLCYLFNMENSVSLASLIDRIESNVRQHASFLRNNRVCKNVDDIQKDEDQKKVVRKPYPFGSALVEFLESRGLLRFTNHYSDEINIAESTLGIPKTFVKRVTKKKTNYYRSSFNYAECTFNTALLPVKLNLPMIYPPKDWDLILPEKERLWINISDVYGGYLSNPTGQIFSSQRTMSSPDPKSFFISFGENQKYETLEKAYKFCTVISSLQRNAFKINTILLKDILENRPFYEKHGFLMPSFLNHVILSKASGILRTHLDRVEYKELKSIYRFSELVTILMKNMQRARYECTILDLAKAYDGYSLYFPAFIDFRGRVYRSGILHFHERDLSRSLLLLDFMHPEYMKYTIDHRNELMERFSIATTFLHESKQTEIDYKNDLIFIKRKLSEKNLNNDFHCVKEILAEKAKGSKRYFQYYSNMLLYLESLRSYQITEFDLFHTVPVTQDASASAYQLMAYFLLDEELARKTNLFNTKGVIHDVYLYIREHFIIYLTKSLYKENPSLCKMLPEIITRSIVKKIFMPIIYGKTVNSTSKDLIALLSRNLLPKECVQIATLCFKFWKDHFHKMEYFIELISLAGRICSSYDRAVLYSTPYYYTSQDYKKMESHSIRVYDTREKKRRSVTLSFPSDVRDKKKSRGSTFVNFIHQKDAHIAMYVAACAAKDRIPLYTVHDNFISNTLFCPFLTQFYLNAFKDMGPPLILINQFLYRNLIEPEIENIDQKYVDRNYGSFLHPGYFDDKIIPMNVLDDFLSEIPISEAKNKAGWKKIIDQFKKSYSHYCQCVCGKEMSFDEHLTRWSRFHSKLVGEFCIHH